MSGTSQKYRSFISEPIGEKSVKVLDGIDEILAGRLIEAGFDKAYNVLGQFLILKRDEDLFKDWMMDEFNASSNEAMDCYNCLNDWCEEFLS